ncbi:hypothetical protein CGLO_03975 [Colletotrichum gloeosporioides Cg-14]|uniref:Uncharacterized protein n=1 Tax=Colletotrichum gloeosporioides (strain Cg-14) TaxID=1237896 RepID=T0M5D9_COLGC|nr:hypothetical protein CGLO_03975 [Colletotrichum gloeosporioides Cg-14]
MAGARVTYRRRNGYNTTSNRTRIVKTPGGELRILHIKKRGTAPKCGDCGVKLPGRIGLLWEDMDEGWPSSAKACDHPRIKDEHEERSRRRSQMGFP